MLTSYSPPGSSAKKTLPPLPLLCCAFFQTTCPATLFSLPLSTPPSVLYSHSLTHPTHSEKPLAHLLPAICVRIFLEIFSILCRLLEHLLSTAFIPFAYEHFVNSPVRTGSTPTVQDSHFLLIQYAAQFTDTLASLPPLTGRAAHLWTATEFRAPFATVTTPAFPLTTSRAFSHFELRTTPSKLALVLLAASSSFSGFSFSLANSFLTPCS